MSLLACRAYVDQTWILIICTLQDTDRRTRNKVPFSQTASRVAVADTRLSRHATPEGSPESGNYIHTKLREKNSYNELHHEHWHTKRGIRM